MSSADVVAPRASPATPRAPIEDRRLGAWNGYLVLAVLVVLLALLAIPASQLDSIDEGTRPLAVLEFALLVLSIIVVWRGMFTVQPNHSVICLLFGRYMGTERRAGLWWVNPFYVRKTISRRLHALECGPLKVNDAIGNPIEIGVNIIWRVEDAAKALLEVSSYEDYVKVQSEAALRQMASIHPYDDIDIEESVLHDEKPITAGLPDQPTVRLTLLHGGDTIGNSLKQEIASRMRPVGIVIDEARIAHLAYTAEIAGIMLRRQAAGAVVAARRLVVKGAVSIVDEALKELDRSGISEGLDPERKAAMISNLLVVLVSDREVTPIINAGTLYS